MSRTIFEGPIASKTKETDGQVWVPSSMWTLYQGTWTADRVAQGNYRHRRTAANAAHIIALNLNQLFRKYGQDPTWDAIYSSAPSSTPSEVAHDIRGVQIRSIDLVYQITTEAMDAHSLTFNQILYANNAAPVVSQPGGAPVGSLATATQAQPYVTNITPTTPYVLGANTAKVADMIELTIDGNTNGLYDLYGAFVNFHYNLL